MAERDYAHTEYARRARETKAIFTADACFDAGVRSGDVPDLTDKRKAELSRAAGQRPGSTETWDLVLVYLARREAEARQPVPTYGEDPYASGF